MSNQTLHVNQDGYVRPIKGGDPVAIIRGNARRGKNRWTVPRLGQVRTQITLLRAINYSLLFKGAGKSVEKTGRFVLDLSPMIQHKASYIPRGVINPDVLLHLELHTEFAHDAA